MQPPFCSPSCTRPTLTNLTLTGTNSHKQIIWCRDMRVVAFQKSDLLLGPDPAHHEVTYTDPRNHDELPFFLHLHRLAKVTGEEIPALQQALRDLQSE